MVGPCRDVFRFSNQSGDRWSLTAAALQAICRLGTMLASARVSTCLNFHDQGHVFDVRPLHILECICKLESIQVVIEAQQQHSSCRFTIFGEKRSDLHRIGLVDGQGPTEPMWPPACHGDNDREGMHLVLTLPLPSIADKRQTGSLTRNSKA
jgi:hypothetical protein